MSAVPGFALGLGHLPVGLGLVVGTDTKRSRSLRNLQISSKFKVRSETDLRKAHKDHRLLLALLRP